MIRLIENYAGLKKGTLCRVITTGPDWVCVAIQGKPLYIFSNFFEE